MGANAQTTVPTFTAGQVLTAAQQNLSARTGVPVFADTTARDAAFGGSGEKTLAEGQLAYIEASDIVQYYDGTSWVTLAPVIRAINNATVATSQTTTSSTYTDLATVGPSVTVTTGTRVLVIVQALVTCTTNTTPRMGFAVSGATTTAAADASSIALNTTGADGQLATLHAMYDVTVTAGSNTFTAKYRSSASTTATFADRSLFVVTL